MQSEYEHSRGYMLCYAMLCYAMLCYAMLCYAITRDTQDSLDNYNECASISDKGK
jgi:hypothetical protein